MNPRYPFGVYTISNRARSASYATSPCSGLAADPLIIQHGTPFVKHYFSFFANLMGELTLVKLGIESVSLQQFLMAPLLHDLAGTHDEDYIRLLNG